MGGRMNAGWMLPNEAFSWIEERIPSGAVVIEFGSGDGSVRLSERFELYSVEHNEDWLHKSKSTYVPAPIVTTSVSTSRNEEGWYDESCFDELPLEAHLLIIDGPPGSIGRSGILNHLTRLPKLQHILVDDVDREAEHSLMIDLEAHFNCEAQIFISEQFKSNGEPRKFAALDVHLGAPHHA